MGIEKKNNPLERFREKLSALDREVSGLGLICYEPAAESLSTMRMLGHMSEGDYAIIIEDEKNIPIDENSMKRVEDILENNLKTPYLYKILTHAENWQMTIIIGIQKYN